MLAVLQLAVRLRGGLAPGWFRFSAVVDSRLLNGFDANIANFRAYPRFT